MGSTSASAALEDDLGLIDVERLAQSGDFSGVTGPELREWCGVTAAGSDTDSEDEGTARQIHALLDAILHQEKRGSAEKQKLDSRTFVRSKRRPARPGLHALLRDSPASPAPASATAHDKFLTYNKYTSPAFRLNMPPQPEAAGADGEADAPHALSRPIDIDLTQPASHLHTTFTRGASERDSFSMFRSGASFLNTSPPSLVSSLVMDASLSATAVADSERSARESLEPKSLLTSMTLSIMEDKDMSTSFLSQSTCHERDSLIGSLPPSLPSSVDSSYRLTQRPRADLFSVHPRSGLMNETVDLPSSDKLCRAQKDAAEHSNDRTRTLQRESPECNDHTRTFHTSPTSPQQSGPETIRKESPEMSSFTRTFKKSTPEHNGFARTYRRDSRGAPPEQAAPEARPALHLALDKRELSEIVRARRQLSLARSALPAHAHTLRGSEETPRLSAALTKHSPRPEELEATVIYVKGDARDAAELGDSTLQHQREEWGQRCAMVGSSDSTDTATLSSSSPPDAPDDVHERNARRQEMSLQQVASTPLGAPRQAGGAGKALLLIHHNISPIYGETPHMRAARRDRPAAPPTHPAPPARRSALPTSKLRQYSSHKELSRIPGGAGAGAAGGAARGALGRVASARRGVYASNPALSPTAPAPPARLQRRDSYTISVDAQERGVPALVRQGTETLRRPHSQLLAPRDNTAASGAAPTPAPVPQQRVRAAPPAHPALRHPAPGAVKEPQHARAPAPPPPRASRLPAPRRSIRPPSVYSVAPARAADGGGGERY